ncbi:MAG TPA: flavodoxin family protein [Petrotogaceae bacterium]|jgi:flavodoxin|nr:flavodoxin family protein [Petrotogaceae bacterium]HOT31791.1 flavodoxin family protein [Petrotogaceae bacterium]HPX15190.1 flavodoxin family protein [Petrotogaceae bacterium]HQC40300.1 flavodoxin family protein [Petrotogaceae bacterium]HQF33700.1 flavodoxin family protein [Petrotogaceae bacterium]
MRSLLLYSTLTGNTEKVAKAVYETMPQGTELKKASNSEEPSDYDVIVIGFWVDRGTADEKILKFVEKTRGKKVAFFFTLGAYPDSPHAVKTAKDFEELLKKNDNEVLGYFMCQGRIDPKLTEKFKDLPKDHPHAMTEERRKRHEEASKHPDENDLTAAKKVFSDIFSKLR